MFNVCRDQDIQYIIQYIQGDDIKLFFASDVLQNGHCMDIIIQKGKTKSVEPK